MTRRLYEDKDNAALYVEVDGDVYDVTSEPDGTALAVLLLGCPDSRRLSESEALGLRAPGGPLSAGMEERCLIAAVVDEGDGPGSPFELQIWRERVDDVGAFLLGFDVRPERLAPQADLPGSPPDPDSRAAMDEAAFRHNLAVALGVMQDAGIDEVVLRTGDPLSSRRLPVIEWHGEDGVGVEVSGLVSPQPLSRGGWQLVEYQYPIDLETVLRSLAYEQLERLDEDWPAGDNCGAEVRVTDQGLQVSVERDVSQRIRNRSMTAPERATDVVPAPIETEEHMPGPGM